MKKFLKIIVDDLRTYIKFQIYKQHLPKLPKHNDVYIVEFPKSGVTWLSFLLANCLVQGKEDITFYNYHKYVVDVHQLRGSYINDMILPNAPYRFIKSHSEYNPFYYFVVYLIRNPFDVMLSLYYYLSNQLDYAIQMNFNEFVRHESYGISKWVSHVESWLLKNRDLAQRLHLIRYEDIIDNPKRELLKLFMNLGIKYDDSIVEQAVDKSSREPMKKSEKFYSENSPVYQKSGLNFIRKGKKYQKDELLNEDIRAYITKHSRHILKKFYPDLLEK